jgi:hypothetical protein
LFIARARFQKEPRKFSQGNIRVLGKRSSLFKEDVNWAGNVE